MSTRHSYVILRSAVVAGVLMLCGVCVGQEAAQPGEASLGESVKELQAQVRELRAAIAEMRAESQQYRQETSELRKELAAVRGTSDAADNARAKEKTSYGIQEPEDPSSSANPTDRATTLEEQYQLLAGKIDEQYQTKIESASKYRVRLSGIVLMNLFGNQGTVDNMDFPAVVYDRAPGSSGGTFGATVRQSQIGLEVFGPELAGARTRADLQFDFAGGFPRLPNGVSAGLVRLRTGTVHLDWGHTSVVAGQDGIFFSPQNPTSFATLAQPALTYAGNLWAWVPQIRVEHRFAIGEDSSLLVQGGVLDGQSGEPPVGTGYRQPQAGERSRVPAFATRAAWSRTIFGQPLRLGVGGYYGRQDYGFSRNVDAWSAMADWEIPLGRLFSLSGEAYRGRALGGLGGGIWRSVLFSGDPNAPDSQVRGLNTAGGWAQMKYRATSRLEFNGGFGEDTSYTADIRAFPFPVAFGDPTLTKNQGSLANVIFRPRSDLLLSAEYRHMKTYTIDNGFYTADHVNLAIGVLF